MNIFERIGSNLRIRFFRIVIKRKKNILIGKEVVFHKVPLIEIHPAAKLIIGNNVKINSENRGYHLNMYGRCKIMLDRPGASISIGDNTRVHGSCIHSCENIEIGKNCLIAANCQIIDSNGHDISYPDVANRINTKGYTKPVYIEDNVWLGTNVVVLPGVRIGAGSIISANSVVHKDIPPMVIAGGNPVKIIKELNIEDNK